MYMYFNIVLQIFGYFKFMLFDGMQHIICNQKSLTRTIKKDPAACKFAWYYFHVLLYMKFRFVG